MGSVGSGGRAVAPERASETPWRVLLASRSLPKGLNHSRRTCCGHTTERNEALASQPAAYGAPRGSLTSSPATMTPTDS